MFGIHGLRSKRTRRHADERGEFTATGQGGRRSSIAPVVASLGRSVIVPVAFDEATERALDLAIVLARRVGGVVHVVHAIEAPILATPEVAIATVGGGVAEEVLRRANESMDALIYRYATALAGCTISGRVDVGPAPQVILNAVAEHDADVVVIPTHARRGVERLLLGSVAEKVVRASTVPVLVAPPPEEHAQSTT